MPFQNIDKLKLIEYAALFIIAVVFLGIFYVILKTNTPLGFILTFSIIVIVIMIFYFFVKDRFAQNFLLKCLIFPVLFLLAMILVLLYFNHNEGQGKNYTYYEIGFDLYILGNVTTTEKFNKDLVKANKIWNKYNITLELQNIFFINEINSSEKYFLLDLNATNDTECLKYRDIISFSNKSELRIILLESGSKHRGRACICGCDSIVVDIKKELFMDLTGWNLAHEFGHFLGLYDIRNRYNLMSDEFKIIRPKFLNRTQVNTVSNIAKGKTIKQLISNEWFS